MSAGRSSFGSASLNRQWSDCKQELFARCQHHFHGTYIYNIKSRNEEITFRISLCTLAGKCCRSGGQHVGREQMNYHKHISGRHRLLDLKLGELWRYRDLVLLLARRTFVVSYTQTILGPLWLILTPLLTSFMYAFLFGNVAGISTDGVPRILFYLFNTAAWSMFSSNIVSCAETFTNNASLLGKVYFPRLAVPLSELLSSSIRYLIQLFPAFLFYIYYLSTGTISFSFTRIWLFLPSVAELILLSYGFGIIVCALTTRYRDLKILVSFGLSLWMFATPIAYPLSALDGRIAFTVGLNPATAPMELMRYALWGKSVIRPWQILLSWILTIIPVLTGTILFNHVERVFADTV